MNTILSGVILFITFLFKCGKSKTSLFINIYIYSIIVYILEVCMDFISDGVARRIESSSFSNLRQLLKKLENVMFKIIT